MLLDEVRAGGRINLIIGRGLTAKAREFLGLPLTLFRCPRRSIPARATRWPEDGRPRLRHARNGKGIRPGTYCEPKMTTVGSQDTTGPMTRDELKDLACLGFSADLVMQSFCHTAAYPKLVDVRPTRTLPAFITSRGGVSLRPGDGVIHSLAQPHAAARHRRHRRRLAHRFPIGISFPGRFGLVALPPPPASCRWTCRNRCWCASKGEMQPGITLRDLVNAIPSTRSRQAC